MLYKQDEEQRSEICLMLWFGVTEQPSRPRFSSSSSQQHAENWSTPHNHSNGSALLSPFVSQCSAASSSKEKPNNTLQLK